MSDDETNWTEFREFSTVDLKQSFVVAWETDGEFNPPFLEVTNEETEYCFDIGKRDEINDLKSSCIYISEEKARELAQWILND